MNRYIWTMNKYTFSCVSLMFFITFIPRVIYSKEWIKSVSLVIPLSIGTIVMNTRQSIFKTRRFSKSTDQYVFVLRLKLIKAKETRWDFYTISIWTQFGRCLDRLARILFPSNLTQKNFNLTLAPVEFIMNTIRCAKSTA